MDLTHFCTKIHCLFDSLPHKLCEVPSYVPTSIILYKQGTPLLCVNQDLLAVLQPEQITEIECGDYRCNWHPSPQLQIFMVIKTALCVLNVGAGIYFTLQQTNTAFSLIF